ncbi:hypothetical protein RN001_000105, partial [Aquatica leii]
KPAMQGGADPSEDYAASRHTVPPIIAVILIIFIFSLYGMVYLIDGVLPTALNILDEKNHLAAFIAERAQQDVKEFAEIVVAVDLLQQKIADIQKNANSVHKIEVDVQVVSGSYMIDLGSVLAYDKVQNVIVKLHSSNNSRNSLLINAHFDTVPGTPGASDNAVNCAVMLEILRKLS